MPEVRKEINAQQLAEIAKVSIRRALAFISLAEKAWGDEQLSSVKISVELPFEVFPDRLPKQIADDVRSAFRSWITAGALTEVVLGLGLYADELYELAVLLPYHGRKIDADAVARIKRMKCDTNVASKFRKISDDCGLRSGLIDHASGWASARNVHAHNRGLLRHRDCTPGKDELCVSWLTLDFYVEGMKIENIIGYTVEKGQALSIGYGRDERTFPIGKPVVFTEQELVNICMTAFIEVVKLSNDFLELAKKRIGKE